MNNKTKSILLYILILIVSCIVTSLAFPISHALDSYCTMCHGYHLTAIWFLQNGRIVSCLFYLLFDLINLSYDILGIISILLGNIFLSYAVYTLYNKLKENADLTKTLSKIVLLMATFLIYYNPLYTSILVFDEAFVIDLGILFLTLASIYMMKKGTKNYFISLLFTILGITCYQGIAAYLPVTLFLLIISNKEKKITHKLFNKVLLTILNYGIAFVSNYFIIKLVNKYLATSAPKLGDLDIISNIKLIFTRLIPDSMRSLFNYIGTVHYYRLVYILIVFIVIYIIKHKNKKFNIISLIFLILSCLFVPFIPNLFMNSSGNYTEARMTLTLGILPAVMIIYLVINGKIKTASLVFLLIIGEVFFLLTATSLLRNMKLDLKRYSNDTEYLTPVVSNIKDYETKNNIAIKHIYYTFDREVAYYYWPGSSNGVNIQVTAVPWAMECALGAKLNRELTYEKMPEDKYKELFGGPENNPNYETKLSFDGDILYLLVY